MEIVCTTLKTSNEIVGERFRVVFVGKKSGKLWKSTSFRICQQ